MTLPFRQLTEEVLIGAAELQAQFDQRSVDLNLVLERGGREVPIDKQMQVVEYLRNQGWIDSSGSTLKSTRLRVTGEGQMEAERLYGCTSPSPQDGDLQDGDLAVGTDGLALSSKKIQLVVLHELFGFAERNQNAPTPRDIAKSLDALRVSLRRVEVALNELESLGHAEVHPDPGAGVFRWQITGEGFGVIDRALKIPVSFIARLAANGNAWLATDDAKKAVLKKLDKPEEPSPSNRAQAPIEISQTPSINITNTYSPTNSNSILTEKQNSVDWPGWVNALIALAVGVGSIFAALWIAGKF